MKRVIYLDMDGVVADFNSYTGTLLGREVGWEGRDLSDDEWKTITSVDHFYLQLPLIPESVELVNLAKQFTDMDLKFLTAIPRRTTMPSAQEDKRKWLGTYFPGIVMEIGPYSKDKQKWANTGDILVDDKLSNVLEWMQAGGISVHHTGNFEKTLANLRKAVTMNQPAMLGEVSVVADTSNTISLVESF